MSVWNYSAAKINPDKYAEDEVQQQYDRKLNRNFAIKGKKPKKHIMLFFFIIKKNIFYLNLIYQPEKRHYA